MCVDYWFNRRKVSAMCSNQKWNRPSLSIKNLLSSILELTFCVSLLLGFATFCWVLLLFMLVLFEAKISEFLFVLGQLKWFLRILDSPAFVMSTNSIIQMVNYNYVYTRYSISALGELLKNWLLTVKLLLWIMITLVSSFSAGMHRYILCYLYIFSVYELLWSYLDILLMGNTSRDAYTQ